MIKEVNIYQDGKEFEKEALGSVDDYKLKNELKDYAIKEAWRTYIYNLSRGRMPSDDNIRRFKLEHPELKDEINREAANIIKLSLETRKSKYLDLDFDGKVELAKKIQPSKRAALADDLYHSVAFNLGLEEMDEKEDYVDFKYYTAVDSALDFENGTDCFLIYNYINEDLGIDEEIITTIDVTLNPTKVGSKAQHILLFQSDAVDKRANWSEPVSDYSEVLATAIKRRIRQLKKRYS